jgi:NTP pyrophosphatase (non-canonical NTP hydrolase)
MINELSQLIHQNAVSKGFYEGEKNIGEILCLIHSEVSEAMEADRKGRYFSISVEELEKTETESDYKQYFESKIKGTFEDELADIIIRVLDLCAYKNINIQEQIIAKMAYNSTREYKHGKKY